MGGPYHRTTLGNGTTLLGHVRLVLITHDCGQRITEKVSALGLKEGTLPSLLSFSKTVGVPFRLRGLEMAVEDLGCVLILESCPFLHPTVGCPGTAED